MTPNFHLELEVRRPGLRWKEGKGATELQDVEFGLRWVRASAAARPSHRTRSLHSRPSSGLPIAVDCIQALTMPVLLLQVSLGPSEPIEGRNLLSWEDYPKLLVKLREKSVLGSKWKASSRLSISPVSALFVTTEDH